MANNEMKVEVDVTAAVHTAFKKFAQEYFEEYGVMLQSIEFDWIEGNFSAGITGVHIESKSL